jgi:hypothetical protein
VRLRVRDGTQVNHEGRLYEGGEEFDAPKDAAQPWLNAGWVSEVKTKRRSTARNKKR